MAAGGDEFVDAWAATGSSRAVARAPALATTCLMLLRTSDSSDPDRSIMIPEDHTVGRSIKAGHQLLGSRSAARSSAEDGETRPRAGRCGRHGAPANHR